MWPTTLWNVISALDNEPRAQANLLNTLAVFPSQQVRPSMSVRAPCCGRKTSADAVADVQAVPGTVVRPGGQDPAEDLDWLCASACLPRLIRDPGNGWTMAKFARAAGAPASDVRMIRAKEMVQEERRRRLQNYRDAKRGGGDVEAAKRAMWINPTEIYGNALASLPEALEEIPGTGRPT